MQSYLHSSAPQARFAPFFLAVALCAAQTSSFAINPPTLKSKTDQNTLSRAQAAVNRAEAALLVGEAGLPPIEVALPPDEVSSSAAAPVQPVQNAPAPGKARRAPLRLAQTNPADQPDQPRQPNTPAAAPQENPRGLTIPVTPDKSTPPEPNPTPGNNAAPATPVTPTTPVTGAGEPPVTTTTPDANVAAAEGREVAQVRVVGNRVIPAETVLLQASTRTGTAFSARQIEIDRAKIDALGFFASVQYQVTPNLDDPNKVDVTFVLIENRVISGFRFEGNTQVKNEDLAKVLESKTGTVLNRNMVNTDVTKLQDLYRARGFAVLVTDARQDENGTLGFKLQEAKISRIAISGLRKTRESLVRRQIRTAPGGTLDQVSIRKDLNRIYDLGFFEDVSYKVEDDPQTPGTVIVTVLVKEKRTGAFSLGVGFDSRSKISGFLTLSERNFQGTGKSVSGSVELGSQRSFDLGFSDPFVGKKNASYDVSVFDRRLFREPQSVLRIIGQPDSNDTTAVSFEERRQGTRLNFNLPTDLERVTSFLLGYRNERVRLFQRDDLNSVPVDVRGLESAGRISAFSTGFLHDGRDLRLDPSRGGREQVLLEKGLSFLGGDANFTKLDLDLRRYFPLMPAPKADELPKLVLAGRLVLGHSFGQLPAFEQYFIGGSDTVRGYDVDQQFGDNQFFTNVELRYRFQRKFQVVGFFDAGKADGGRFSSSERSLLTSFGVGVRLQTPIGPIRLDIGRGREGVRTHFAIGPTF